MATKSAQLQIRVTPRQKALLKRQAVAAGQELSAYVLARVLPPAEGRFDRLVAGLGSEDPRFVLAELHDFLAACPPMMFADDLANPPPDGLPAWLLNYLAAMVETAAMRKGLVPPAWTRRIAPLATPHFATPLASLRLHLLRSAPVAFKRRNIFVDSTIGARA
jgi:hypothetical protein